VDIAEQRRLADTIQRVHAVIRKREQAGQLTDKLVHSVFLEMFGNPSTNPKAWKFSALKDVCTKVTDGEHVTPPRTSSGIMLLSARNVKHGYIDLSEQVDFISPSEYERIRKRCDPEYGDVLLSCSGTVGRVAMVDIKDPFTLVRSVALLKLRHELVTPEYVQCFLQSAYAQAQIRRGAHQSSQANIFQGQVRGLKIAVPPLEAQEKFSDRLSRIKRLRKRQETSGEEISTLFHALMHKTFRGELTVSPTNDVTQLAKLT
jgi:type I restriction enzyme S subunit